MISTIFTKNNNFTKIQKRFLTIFLDFFYYFFKICFFADFDVMAVDGRRLGVGVAAGGRPADGKWRR